MTDLSTSTTAYPDWHVFPPKDVDDRQSSRPDEIGFADCDGHVNPGRCEDIDEF